MALRNLYGSVPAVLLFFLLLPELNAQDPEGLLLRDYRPESLYHTPENKPLKASFPVIDMHTHDNAASKEEVKDWVRIMDSCGIAKSVILSCATGAEFDSIIEKYSDFPDRFEVWCGFDYTGYDQPGWGDRAVKELERCYKKGAGGVGEEGDKGLGLFYSRPVKAYGMHLDDPRMKPLLKKCGELKMPVSIHVADPIWMYEKMDSTNDGLMNAWEWKIDLTKPGILGFDELIASLENAVRDNPGATFITCHFANLNHDPERLGRLFDKYPNLYADISARYSEAVPIPRYMQEFFKKYSNRLVYGTDMGNGKDMYRVTFRILETRDEHFYEHDLFTYHWPLNGLDLSPDVLQKLYFGNALNICSKLK
jgi:uncharacterized protein